MTKAVFTSLITLLEFGHDQASSVFEVFSHVLIDFWLNIESEQAVLVGAFASALFVVAHI